MTEVTSLNQNYTLIFRLPRSVKNFQGFHKFRQLWIVRVCGWHHATDIIKFQVCRSRWSRCLGCGSAALACWNCGLKSRRQYGCLSVVSCQVQVSATGWSFVQRSPTDGVCASECDQAQKLPSTRTVRRYKIPDQGGGRKEKKRKRKEKKKGTERKE